MVIAYGGAADPLPRTLRSFHMFYAEQPYAKPAIFGTGALLFCATLLVFGKRQVQPLAARVLSAAAAISRRVNAWLHPAPAPAYVQAPQSPPAARPMYYDIRYPNQSYRLAAYCFAAFWIVLAAPLTLALILPAWLLLLDFSAAGFQKAYGAATGILLTFFSYGRLWFALLLLSIMGFAVFKLYGRFSLPKPMRPRIRLVYGTLRFAFFGFSAPSSPVSAPSCPISPPLSQASMPTPSCGC
jgi:hypothetical protein